MKKLLFLINLMFASFAFGQFGAPSYEEIITTEIIPEYSVWEKETQRVLVHTKIQEGFSYYWRNGGESGVPFDIKAKLPEGVELVDIVWGAPKYKIFFGQKTFAYVGGSWHLLTLKKSADMQGDIKLVLNNNFQVCNDQNCFAPRSLSFEQGLKIGSEESNSTFNEQLKKASSYLPTEQANVDAKVLKTDSGFELEIAKPANAKEVFFFNDSANLEAFDQKWVEKDGRLKAALGYSEFAEDKEEKLTGTLLVKTEDGQQAYIIDFSKNKGKVVASKTMDQVGEVLDSGEEKPGFFKTILLMFVGGLLLNLMLVHHHLS